MSLPDTAAVYAAGDFTANATEALIRTGVIVVVAVVATLVARAVVERVVARFATRALASEPDDERAATRSDTIASVLLAIAKVAIWSMAILLILGEFGFDLAPLIAGAGIVGLAIGFGAQGLVADVVSGLFMLVEDQYGVGDWVDVGEAAGVVEHVGLRTTRVRSLDGLLWTIRNGEIARTANANQGWGRAVLDVGVGYDTDLRAAQEVVLAAARSTFEDADHAEKFLDEPEIWGIQDLGDDAVTIRLVARTRPGLQWGVARVLRLRVKEALDERGMEIPFPQRTVWIRTEPETLAAAIPVAQVAGNGSRR